jgi:hypothetical protein
VTILSSAHRAGFAQLARSLGGQVGLAVSGTGRDQPVERLGPLQDAVAWSTSKVPVAMAVIADGRAATHQQDLAQAITVSDNAAAVRLWESLGGGQTAARALEAQLRAAGDDATQIEYRTLRASFTPFGQTAWSLSNQVRFAAGMGCTDAGRQALALMGEVAASERWGLGAAGVPARLKGGWGPGWQPGVAEGYLDRQMGVVIIRGVPVAVAIAALSDDGGHEDATRALTLIARWLVAHANVRGLPIEPAC